MNVRPVTHDDFERLLALLAADDEHVHGRPSKLTVGDLREWMSRTDLANDSWLYEDDGALCAVGWFDVVPGNEVAFAIGVVHPAWKGRGLGAQLVAQSEGRARHYGVARLQQFAFAMNTAGMELLTAHGYREVRRFFEMAIQLDGPPEVPDMGIETVDPDEVRAFHAALDESFEDHWEHHSTPFEEWWGRHAANPNLDLSLWFLIRDGNEVAAVVRNEANRNGGGYVGAIGVRRPWRGKGYAKALLVHTFREFYERAIPRVTLGVDAENPTGATHLYERVGMHVEQEHVVFEKAFE
jgi:mycothiol synthase